ncbi:MAG: peroxiredoxin [Gammaproteobacteria bacterium]|nr:peroxiredoxin [Gammaproteobacteria bacterium]
MEKATIDKIVPDISLKTTAGDLKLSELRGHNLVLYFYPKDNTPGCTAEGQAFRDNYRKFTARNTKILGASRDTLPSHERFKQKYSFPFELVSDPDEELCKAFDVIKEKKLYGKKFLGVDRSTFIIDAQGVLKKDFRGVKVKGHVEEVLAAIKAL